MSFVARSLQTYAEGRLAMALDVFAHSKDPDGPAIVVHNSIGAWKKEA